jgi:hypothetical protein
METSTTFLNRVNDQRVGQDDSQEQRLALGVSQLTLYGGTCDVELSETNLQTSRHPTGSEQKANREGASSFPYPFRPRSSFIPVKQTCEDTTLLKTLVLRSPKTQILIAQNNLTISKEDFRRQVINITSRVQQAY